MSRSIQSPDAPKRPPRPFVKFMTEKMSEIRQNNPGASAPKISKIASQLWNELGTEEKTELRDLGKPKKPPNAYMVFLRSFLPEQGGVPMKLFLKQVADHWHNIPKEGKEIYEKDAREEREKYKKELEEWEKKMIEIGREDLVRKSFLAKAKRT
ncbi:transcription factor A, mitochondrial-like [Pomacea canaliculata]|uniref:transcription factor A, mitochondrial-like n=1 Tax=Pomacea canaliculata TaxID=400727 RepID=UPI000D731FC6|nr:transcription factor A, mitochondrial-like [Pomacea canaliculata]